MNKDLPLTPHPLDHPAHPQSSPAAPPPFPCPSFRHRPPLSTFLPILVLIFPFGTPVDTTHHHLLLDPDHCGQQGACSCTWGCPSPAPAPLLSRVLPIRAPGGNGSRKGVSCGHWRLQAQRRRREPNRTVCHPFCFRFFLPLLPHALPLTGAFLRQMLFFCIFNPCPLPQSPILRCSFPLSLEQTNTHTHSLLPSCSLNLSLYPSLSRHAALSISLSISRS